MAILKDLGDGLHQTPKSMIVVTTNASGALVQRMLVSSVISPISYEAICRPFRSAGIVSVHVKLEFLHGRKHLPVNTLKRVG